MFVTFYSYKGGVGRTLALANVAYLLATDKRNPCKILLWDFDLEAPGLQQIFKVKWSEKKVGFVDLVYEYINKTKIGKIKEYIHKTDVVNIDILPAGYINQSYSEKLEKINWIHLYAEARGYDFVQNLKKQIDILKYDYVLVDSRTGYSDVGNICVIQIPDIVALFFRLNNQNIEGTKEVYNIIKSHKEQQNKTVIPVITPFWPFSEGAVEANAQIDKVQSLFQDLQLLKITFDAGLTYQERIICRDVDNLKIKPTIYKDYLNLIKKIRSNNPIDTINLENQADLKKEAGEFDEAFKYYQRLVELRPENENYWRNLFVTAKLGRGKKELYTQLESTISLFLKNQPKNYLPIFMHAEFSRLTANKENLSSILQDYSTALKLSKSHISVLFGRANFYADQLKEFDKAIEDYNIIIQKDSNNDQAYYLRGVAYFNKKDYSRALEDFLMVKKLKPPQFSVYYQIARIYFLTKRYTEAKDIITKYLKISPAKILYSHIMAALDNKQESLSIIEKDKKTIADLDRIEIYIVNFEIDKALNYLKQIENNQKVLPRRDKIVLAFLNLSAQILKNQQINIDDFDKLINEERGELSNLGWSFEEMGSFLSTALEKNLITDEQKNRIENLIRKIESIAV